jgi:hypothetical protein
MSKFNLDHLASQAIAAVMLATGLIGLFAIGAGLASCIIPVSRFIALCALCVVNHAVIVASVPYRTNWPASVRLRTELRLLGKYEKRSIALDAVA